MKRVIALGVALLFGYPLISWADGADDVASHVPSITDNAPKAWIVPTVRSQNKPPLDSPPEEVVLMTLQANRCLRWGKLSNGADAEDSVVQGQLAESTVALAKQKTGMTKVVRVEDCDTRAYGFLMERFAQHKSRSLQDDKKENLGDDLDGTPVILISEISPAELHLDIYRAALETWSHCEQQSQHAYERLASFPQIRGIGDAYSARNSAKRAEQMAEYWKAVAYSPEIRKEQPGSRIYNVPVDE